MPMFPIETVPALIVKEVSRVVAPVAPPIVTLPAPACRDRVLVVAPLPFTVPVILMPPVAPAVVIVILAVMPTFPFKITLPGDVEVEIFPPRRIFAPVVALVEKSVPPKVPGTLLACCRVVSARNIKAAVAVSIGLSVSPVAAASGPVIVIVPVQVMACTASTFKETPL